MKQKPLHGVSLIISMIFVSFFMLLMAGMAETFLASIRSRANWEAEDNARYLLETVEELASYAASQHGAGWNSTGEDIRQYEEMLWAAARELGYENCDAAVAGTKKEPCAGFSVVGRTAPSARVKLLGTAYYSVPAAVVEGEGAAAVVKGTGDAAESCNPTQYPVSGGDNANDPCHWNKLKVGQTVEIPLYNDENDSPQFTAFKLRVRAPCPDLGSSCADSERVVLYPPVSAVPEDPYRDFKKDPVLVQWLISGTSTAETGGASKTLIGRDERLREKRHSDPVENTEISGGRINEALVSGGFLTDYNVLEENQYGVEISPAFREREAGRKTIREFTIDTNNPVLRLTLANQPHRNTVNQVQYNPAADADNPEYRVPFLEYQLLVNCLGVCAPGDSKEVLTGWVEVGNFRKEFRKYRRKEPSLGGFVLENF